MPLTAENLRKKVENGFETTGPTRFRFVAKMAEGSGLRSHPDYQAGRQARSCAWDGQGCDGPPSGTGGVARERAVPVKRIRLHSGRTEHYLTRNMRIIRVNPTVKRWYPHVEPFVGRRCYEAYPGFSHPCDACRA